MPPAAMIGTSTFERTSGSSTMVATSRGFLKPPPSPPSTTRPSTPASIALRAPRSVGTTWKTVRPACLSARAVLGRVAGRGGDELDALLDDEVDDAGVAHERLRDVDAERLVGEVAHLADLVADLVELARGRLDDAHRAGVRDRRGELGARDPAHRRLDDRVRDAEQLGDARAQRGVGQNQRCSCSRLDGLDDRVPVGAGLAGHGHEVVDAEQVGHARHGQHASSNGVERRPPRTRSSSPAASRRA